MGEVRFELNYEGIGQLLQSPEMENALMELSSAYDGDRKIWHSSTRAAVQIYRDNGDKDNNLLKSLFGGGDRHDS